MNITRTWAMPNSDTFSVPPIREFVTRWLEGRRVIVDPFARNERLATYTNDIDPDTDAEHHMEARTFLAMLAERGVKAEMEDMKGVAGFFEDKTFEEEFAAPLAALRAYEEAKGGGRK